MECLEFMAVIHAILQAKPLTVVEVGIGQMPFNLGRVGPKRSASYRRVASAGTASTDLIWCQPRKPPVAPVWPFPGLQEGFRIREAEFPVPTVRTPEQTQESHYGSQPDCVCRRFGYGGMAMLRGYRDLVLAAMPN